MSYSFKNTIKNIKSKTRATNTTTAITTREVSTKKSDY